MSELKNQKSTRGGACLCGAVRFKTNSSEHGFGACHCTMCRKWSGGPFMEVECGSQVEFEGKEFISVYAASSIAERGFCKRCGTHLFMRAIKDNAYGIPPGLFDDDAEMVFERQVFIDKKPSYYGFGDDTRDIDSAYIYQHYPEVKGV
jgi:hypothetical protein